VLPVPRIQLTPHGRGAPFPIDDPNGGRVLLPRVQLRCWVQLPGLSGARDGIIDTGSPYTWFPDDIWRHLVPGTDFEWLPFAANYQPPLLQTAGWSGPFRFARFLKPVLLLDGTTQVARDGVVAQFADGTPPVVSRGLSTAFIVGVRGGLLDGARLHLETGAPGGALEW
jgi:hypothetical protein